MPKVRDKAGRTVGQPWHTVPGSRQLTAAFHVDPAPDGKVGRGIHSHLAGRRLHTARQPRLADLFRTAVASEATKVRKSSGRRSGRRADTGLEAGLNRNGEGKSPKQQRHRRPVPSPRLKQICRVEGPETKPQQPLAVERKPQQENPNQARWAMGDHSCR